jgi:hypothetical protein
MMSLNVAREVFSPALGAAENICFVLLKVLICSLWDRVSRLVLEGGS